MSLNVHVSFIIIYSRFAAHLIFIFFGQAGHCARDFEAFKSKEEALHFFVIKEMKTFYITKGLRHQGYNGYAAQFRKS